MKVLDRFQQQVGRWIWKYMLLKTHVWGDLVSKWMNEEKWLTDHIDVIVLFGHAGQNNHSAHF